MERKVPRRSSTGRSNIIEQCIKTLEEIIKLKETDFEDISYFVINNTLPNELRSIAWKIFLGIFPRGLDPFEWVQIIKTERENFDKVCKDKDVDQLLKLVRKEEELKEGESSDILEVYKKVVDELEYLSTYLDFFKSQIVAETLLRLYIIWKINNPDLTSNTEPFYILAGIIYSLYPSIIHFTTELKEIKTKEDVDSQTLFYFLNNEEYFDADVYLIFNVLMNEKGLKNLINESSSLKRQNLDTIKTELIGTSDLFPLSEEKKNFISTLNKYERMSYFYLKLSNENLLNHLLSLNLDPYEVVRVWSLTLLTSTISFEHLTYFWDNIFLNSTSGFEFLDFLVVALLSHLNSLLMVGDIQSIQNSLMRYPEQSLNLKEIIKKSMKIRDKVSESMQTN